MSRLTKANISLSVGLVFCLSCLSTVSTEATATPLRPIVNSNQDGAITPDAGLTLREAIALVNGDLLPTQLSNAETTQVTFLRLMLRDGTFEPAVNAVVRVLTTQ